MLKISVKADVQKVQMQLLRLANEGVRRAAAVAMNDTAFAASKDARWFMEQVFDRPTPFTLRGNWVEKARPNRLTAIVSAEGKPRDRASRYAYLRPHIEGGGRALKGIEKLLIEAGLLYPGEFLVPSKFMRRDVYGNVPASEIQKILANLRAYRDPQQRTPWGGARGGRKKTEYFWHRRGGGFGSRPGSQMTAIWRRTAAGNAVPAFIVTRTAPKYRRRFPFEKIVNVAINRVWPTEFERQVLAEIRKT